MIDETIQMQDETLTETLSLIDEETPLPEGWRFARIGELCTRLDYGFTASANFTIKEPKFLRITDIQNGYVDWDKVPSCKIGEKEEKSNLLKDGDIVFARTGGTVGKSFLISNPPRAVFASYLIRLSPNELVDNSFLYHFFQSDYYWQQIKASAQGGAQPNVNATILSGLKLALPPTIEEQRRIASVLDEQMKAVEQARLAVEAQLKAANLLPNAFLRVVFESEEAQNWQKRKLVEIGKIKAGGTPSRGYSKYFKGNINWVKTLDLNCGLVKHTQEQITEEALSSMRGQILPIGTVMVAMYGGAGTIGKSGLLGIEAATNQAVCSILPNNETFVPEFLSYWLVHIRPEWMEFSSGNRRDPNINKNAVEQMLCPLPSINEQKKFAERLNEQMQAAETLKKSLTEKLEAVKKLPAALLRKAFAGEI